MPITHLRHLAKNPNDYEMCQTVVLLGGFTKFNKQIPECLFSESILFVILQGWQDHQLFGQIDSKRAVLLSISVRT